MKNIFMICLCLCLTGCMHFSRGYSQKENTMTYEVAETQKVPLAFSVVLDVDGQNIMSASDVKQLAEKVQKSLEDTGLFSSVRRIYGRDYVPDNYYVSFVFHRSCNEEGFSPVGGFFWGLTYGVIPAGEDYYFDGAAMVYLGKKEITSIGKTETLTCIYWSPCIIVYPFANGYFAWDNVEDKIINGLVNDFTKNHMERLASKE